jgi:hypothetical protein
LKKKQNKKRNMAGALKTYEMPNLTKKAEKRDRADDLFKSMGLEPIEGKAEEEGAERALDAVAKTNPSDNIAVEKIEDAFEFAVKQAIATRESNAPPDTYWDAVVKAYEELQKAKQTNLEKGAFENLKRAYDLFSTQPIKSSPPLKKKVENIPLKKTISFAQDALRMGLYYLDSFIGMVATRLADRNVSIYFNNSTRMPLDTESVETIEDFVRKNTHLGEPFLEMILSQYRLHDPKNLLFKDEETEKKVEELIQRLNSTNNLPQKTNSNVSLIGDDVNNVLVRTGNFLNRILQPKEDVGFVTNEKKEWVFNVLDLAALSQVLTPGSLGAITMAVAQINRIPNCERFTLKQLIMSEGVRDIFAIFVAFQYQLASGGNAYAGRASTQGNARGTTFMLSAGLETRKQLNTLVMGAKDWFSDVYETTNPIYTKISGEIEEAKRERTALPLTERWKKEIDLSTNVRVLDTFVNDSYFVNNLSTDQKKYVKLSLDILQREQFLNGIPQKILRRVN